MIRWPERVPAIVKQNLDRFRATSLAARLEEDEKEYAFETLAWNREFPMHFRLCGPGRERVDVVIDEHGWRRGPVQEEPHFDAAPGRQPGDLPTRFERDYRASLESGARRRRRDRLR